MLEEKSDLTYDTHSPNRNQNIPKNARNQGPQLKESNFVLMREPEANQRWVDPK